MRNDNSPQMPQAKLIVLLVMSESNIVFEQCFISFNAAHTNDTVSTFQITFASEEIDTNLTIPIMDKHYTAMLSSTQINVVVNASGKTAIITVLDTESDVAHSGNAPAVGVIAGIATGGFICILIMLIAAGIFTVLRLVTDIEWHSMDNVYFHTFSQGT